MALLQACQPYKSSELINQRGLVPLILTLKTINSMSQNINELRTEIEVLYAFLEAHGLSGLYEEYERGYKKGMEHQQLLTKFNDGHETDK